jgi:flagellar protein FliO/FliZ
MQSDILPLARLFNVHLELQNLVGYVRATQARHVPATGATGATGATAHAAGAVAGVHVSLVSLLGRLVISLLVVLGVLWGLAQIVRRRGMSSGARTAGRRAGSRPRPLDIVSRQSLGKGQALVTVRLEDRVLLLGVTPQNITTLSVLDHSDVGTDEAPPEVVQAERRSHLELQGNKGRSLPGQPGRGAGRSGNPHPLSWAGRIEQWRAMTVRR